MIVFRFEVLGERLASMLDHNLTQLCGKKCTDLKVSAQSRAHFILDHFGLLLFVGVLVHCPLNNPD